MRIRKRQVPLPFSSISPVPLSSDPNFNRSSPAVQLRLQRQHRPPLPTPCFDDPPNHPIGQRLPTHGRDSSAFPAGTTTTTTHGEELRKKENYLVLKQEEGQGEKSNDTRKKSVLGEELRIGSLPQSSSSHQAVGRWVEGEKAFPLKKRRGSFENTIMAADQKDNKKVMIKTKKMKTKMNKKFVLQQNENELQEENKESKDSTKKRGRSGAAMEGSRCSRVNGRGWRCCQQTLVGYSLCEHHLGKSRLRSMTSVRNRSSASSSNNAANNNDNEYQTLLSNYSSSSSQQAAKQTKRELLLGENGDEEEREDQKPLMMSTKKRVKLGMVKARSLSSLLGQNDDAIAVADHNN